MLRGRGTKSPELKKEAPASRIHNRFEGITWVKLRGSAVWKHKRKDRAIGCVMMG